MDNFLGEKLKAYRQEHGLTQKQLADLLFVSDKTISKWERGAGKPDLDMLKDVAALLEISVDDLLNEREPNFYFEYKSERLFMMLPLFHIVLPNLGVMLRYNFLAQGRKNRYKWRTSMPVAKGVFCAGLRAKGIFSVGLISQGIVSYGILSMGLLAGGMATLGVISLGNLAIGGLAFGNFALALIAIGNLAIGYFGLGNLALGVIALGNQSSGTWAYSLGNEADLPELLRALHQVQQEAIPGFVRDFLIQPLEHIMQNEWLLALIILLVVGLSLAGIFILGITALTKIFQAAQ